MPDPEVRTPIYFKKDTYLARQQALLTAWKGNTEDKEALQGFYQHLFAKGAGKARVGKVMCLLRKTAELAPKSLRNMERKDMEYLVALINQSELWKENTKSDYRRALKQFYRWYENEDLRLIEGNSTEREAAKRLYKYLQTEVPSKPKRQSLDYSGILTDQDAQLLIAKGCQTSFERATIAVLHESGCRIGEFLGMRICDLQRKDRHGMMKVDGKTGERRIPLVQSLPYLEQWLQDHPYKDNPNALLWISTHVGRYYLQPLRYLGIKRLLERVADRAGLKKKHNAHWFRHSRATILAPQYSEAVLCKIMGWSIGSAQVRTYVHLGASQVENAFLKHHGIAPEERTKPDVQFCVCGTTNTASARYCFKCGNALNIATIVDDELKKTAAIDEALHLFADIMSNPELRKQFEEYKRNKEA